MNTNDEAKKPKIGGLRQQRYSTIGGPRAPDSETLDAKTSKNQSTQEPEYSSAKEPEHQSTQELKDQSTQEPKRKRHTIYLTPGLSKWLRVYAANAEQDMSEVAELALQQFREATEK